jgi:hypothetical protein
MSRNLSLAARRAITAQETDELFLVLLTIGAGLIDPPIRVVNDGAALTSRGAQFVAFPFEIELPSEEAETIQRVTLRIDNVDRAIVAALRALLEPPTVSIEVVRRAEPDVIEAGPFDMRIVAGTYDANVVEVELGFEDVLNARFPADDFAPADYPGLF